MRDAEPGDLYIDQQGKLWRIIAVCHEPTIVAEEVEASVASTNPNMVAGGLWASTRIEKRRLSGGMSGLMWHGWNRIWRSEWRGKQPPTEPVA